MSRRAAAALLVAIVVVGALVLVAVASGDKRNIAFSTAVPPTQAAALVLPGTTVCQTAVHVDGAFDVLRLGIAGIPPGPQTTITVRRSGRRTVLAAGTISAGFARSPRLGFQAVRLSRRVSAGGYADVCIRVRGAAPVFLAGHRDPGGHVVLFPRHGRERRFATDIHLEFLRARPRSVLAQIPSMFHRAALFRADPVGPWTYWLLVAVLLVAVPALLVRSLWTADSPEEEERTRR